MDAKVFEYFMESRHNNPQTNHMHSDTLSNCHRITILRLVVGRHAATWHNLHAH